MSPFKDVSLSWGLSFPQEAVGDRIPVLLLGNKIDNEKEREVPRLGESSWLRRGEHPASGLGGTPRGLGHVPELGWDPSWGSLGRKQAGRDGVLASGGSPAAVHVELSAENQVCAQTRLGVEFLQPLP